MNKKFILLTVIACAAGCMQDVQASAPSLLTQKQPFTFNGYVYQLSVQAYAAAQRMIDRLRQGRASETQVETFLKASDENPQPVQEASSTDFAVPASQVMASPAPSTPASLAQARPRPPVAQKPTQRSAAIATSSAAVTSQAPQAQMCASGMHAMPSACVCASASAMTTPLRPIAPIMQDALSAQRISLAAKQRGLSRITDEFERAIALAEIARLQSLLDAASAVEVARLSQTMQATRLDDEDDEDLQKALAMSMGESVRPADQSYTERLVSSTISPEQYALSQMTPQEIQEQTEALIAQELLQARQDHEAATFALLAQEEALEKAARLERIFEAYRSYHALKLELGEEVVISMLEGNFEDAEREALLAALTGDIEEQAGIELIKQLLP